MHLNISVQQVLAMLIHELLDANHFSLPKSMIGGE